DSAHYPAIVNRASALVTLGYCDSARVFVQSIMGRYADSAAMYVILGNTFLCENNRNNWDIARQMYSEALQKDTCSAPAYVGLGRTMGLLGVHDFALEQFQRAIECDPSSQVAHFNAGAAMLITGDYAGAVRHLEIAVDLDPKDEDAQKYLREARQKLQAGN
ncbi:MAG: hypothetical protein KAW61_07390, partial [candidate division Zixibacteria bacterium]|nr:hypothetical protein [candidate division Zixibacteria bacterium]